MIDNSAFPQIGITREDLIWRVYKVFRDSSERILSKHEVLDLINEVAVAVDGRRGTSSQVAE